MSLLAASEQCLSSSMQNLNHVDEEEESFKLKLKRTFSSLKRRKRKQEKSLLTIPADQTLQVPSGRRHLSVIVPLLFGNCTPASDLSIRRDAFSRRHYGSVELLTSFDADTQSHAAGRFRVETGDLEGDEPSLNSPIHLENPEFQTRWYFKYFLGKLHQNYVGSDSEKEAFILSVIVTDATNHTIPQYRAILWRKKGAKKICLPYNSSKQQTVKCILSHFGLDKIEKGPKEIFDPEIQKDLLVLEEQEGSVNFKFGVVYAKINQTTDDEFYSNEYGSDHFKHFTTLLGNTVQLKGWEKFRAGLDIKSNSTGSESVYTVYEGHEIMFHVSTLLPHSKDNRQQVERKRHIGNDIVNIIFYECDSPRIPLFNPSMIKSRFTHIFAVVCYNTLDKSYRLNIYSEESVPLFGPPLPVPPVFYDHQEFRDFLLVKLINGEKAAVNNPMFTHKRERTLEMLIKNIQEEYMAEANKNSLLYRRALSDVIQDHQSARKEEARRDEYVRVGQTLKLKTILKGDAPTSMVTTGSLKKEPWEPHQCFGEISNQIICGDSWGERLIISTDNGTLLLEEGAEPRIIIDKSVCVRQLSVIEAHGLLIMRTDKNKGGTVYIFRLMDLEDECQEQITKNKLDCKENKLEKTKGCHLYAVSRASSRHLRMVVAVQKKLLLFQWKHSAPWSTWCPTIDVDGTDGFNFVRELQVFDVPQLLTLTEGHSGDNQICVAYKNQFDLINEKNGDTLQLYHVDANKVNLVSALDIYEDEEAELFLTYNYVSHLQKLTEEVSNDLDIQWNSEPQSIVCAFPYVMAFTPDTIEIRLIINGNLVHTMPVPDLKLITSTGDIYFATLSGPGVSPLEKVRQREFSFTPPSSPSAKQSHPAQRIYRIPFSCLTGQNTERNPQSSSTLLAPDCSNGEKSPTPTRRSPLLRTKRVQQQQLPDKDTKERHDSSSSDSGITILKPNVDISPPQSPQQKPESCAVFLDQETDLL